MKKNLDEHLEKDCPNRDYKCPHCGEESTYAEITEVHDQACEEKIIPCQSSECTKTMARKEMQEHVARECKFAIVPCKYGVIGCGVKRKRKDMSEHEADKKSTLIWQWTLQFS